jgi:ribosome-binding factor A
MRKVNEILREAIADECQNLKDPRIGFLTITGVQTSPDLRNATVFYSVLADESADAADALESAAPRIRAAIGGQVRMKYVPKLTFTLDPSIEYGQRISKILRSIEPGGHSVESGDNAAAAGLVTPAHGDAAEDLGLNEEDGHGREA